MALSIQDILGGSLADAVKGIIGEFKLDPTVKAQLEQQVENNAVALQQKEMEWDQALNAVAGQNIQAEARSGDKYTSRARPSFMYIVEAILGFNYIVIPLAALFGSKLSPFPLPSDLLTLFGVCITGYVVSRSTDKALALPGDSQIKLPGISLSNKQ